MSFTVLEPSGVNSSATFTFANIVVTGNITSGNGNIDLGNSVSANYFIGNGALLTGIAASYSNTNVADYLPTYTGNLTAGNANLGNVITANFFIGNGSLLTGLPASYSNTNVAAYLPTYTGNISANNFIGNGSLLTSITGANIAGQVSNALVAGTVYSSSQPNITSVGTLSSLTVSGMVTATSTGIKTANVYDSTSTLTIETKYNNNAGDVGIYGNVVIGTSGAGNITAYNANLGNLIIGNYLQGTLTTATQPNITSVGTLASLAVTSNVSAGNILTNNLLYANGVAWDLGGGSYGNTNVAAYLPTYTGNFTANNANISNNLTLSSGSGGSLTGANLLSANFITGTLTTAAQPNITSVGTLANLSVTSNVSAGNVLTNNLLYANGVAWSFSSSYSNTNVAAYLPTYTGNVSANFFNGNRATITGNASFGNIANTTTIYSGSGESRFWNGTYSDPDTSGARAIKVGAGGLAVFGGTRTDTLTVTGNANISGTLTSGLTTTGKIVITNSAGMNSQGESLFFSSTFTDPDSGVSRAVKISGNGLAVVGGTKTDTLTATGNISASYVSGNGSLLTSINGSNVTGQVGNALVAGTVYTNAQPNITSLGTLTSLVISGNANVSGWASLQETTEVVSTKTGATGTVTHDLSTGLIFYHTSPAANFTANFTNVPTTSDRSITVTLAIAQGVTPYIPNAVQIDGVGQTILWFGSTIPTGTASKTDFFAFNLLRISTTWYVYGSAINFG